MDKVIHFEIPVEDMSRAHKFYQKVFGWQIKSVPEVNYTLVYTTPVDDKQMHLNKGAINGGMLQRQGVIKSPIITINVEDIDQSLKNLEKAGGKIVMPKSKVGDIGLSAYFQDTEGNVLGVWQSLKR